MNTKFHILANKSYGLYYARIIEHDPASGIAKVENCRHICRWYGKEGGITSLAAHGPCGSQAKDSRIGAPCTATLTGIVNTFEVSDKAAAAFSEIGTSDE